MNKEKLRNNEINKIKPIKGKVVWYNISLNYGFITGEDGYDYFVHFNEIEGISELLTGDVVQFTPSENRKGKIAIGVKVID